MCCEKEDIVNLPIRDLAEAKDKTDIFLNVTLEDKKKLINLNSWAIRAFELSILERVKKKNLKAKQGEVWSIDLGENIGAEMNNTRPCIILSCDKFDGTLVTIVPITNTETNYPSQVSVKKLGISDYLTGIAKSEQIKTVSKSRLGKKICELPSNSIYLLQESLLKHIGLNNEFLEILNSLFGNQLLTDNVLKMVRENKGI